MKNVVLDKSGGRIARFHRQCAPQVMDQGPFSRRFSLSCAAGFRPQTGPQTCSGPQRPVPGHPIAARCRSGADPLEAPALPGYLPAHPARAPAARDRQGSPFRARASGGRKAPATVRRKARESASRQAWASAWGSAPRGPRSRGRFVPLGINSDLRILLRDSAVPTKLPCKEFIKRLPRSGGGRRFCRLHILFRHIIPAAKHIAAVGSVLPVVCRSAPLMV